MKIPFIKAQGTGNDFIIFLKEECPQVISKSNFIKKISARRTGIGADGVIILSNDKNFDYKMDYYNCDGTWETFCANGARCAAMVMLKRDKVQKEINFIAGDGPHRAIVNNKNVNLKMKKPEYMTESITINGITGRLVDSGARHFVTEVKDFNSNQVELIAPQIRYAEIFKPKGVNVNFFEYIDEKTIKIWTYEKGIEKLMLSCGSGSSATVFHASQTARLKSPIDCLELGGTLSIKYDKNWENVWLLGKTEILFESELDIGNW